MNRRIRRVGAEEITDLIVKFYFVLCLAVLALAITCPIAL